MSKIAKLKRESNEQISNYATRVLQHFNTLQRLHPSGAAAYPNAVKQSDSIIKLLELLPTADRKWIKTDQPLVNTYYEVLKQILSYVEKEPSLKLTIDDIEKEVSKNQGLFK